MDPKWIGVGMAMLGSVALGLGLSRAVGGRAEALEELLRAMRLLSARLLALHEPMEQVEHALGEESEVFRRLAAFDEPDIAKRWEAAMDGIRSLTQEDRGEIVRLVTSAAAADREGQRGVFETGLAMVADRAEQARSQAGSDRKLYRELGFLGAISIVILAI